MAPYPATTIANEFLRLSFSDDIPITHMKLQKLVYIAHGWYMVFSNGNPLIEERVQAWEYGPVISNLYNVFADYKKTAIDKLHRNIIVVDGVVRIREPKIDDDDAIVRAVVDGVWGNYKEYSAYQLSSLTHQDDTPWHKARVAKKSTISDKVILEYYQQLTT